MTTQVLPPRLQPRSTSHSIALNLKMLDPSRKDILSLLSSMGVELPPTTRMSDSLLSKRLDRTLDAAQYLTQLFPDNPELTSTATEELSKPGTIDMANLQTWTEGNLKTALRRQTIKESLGLEDIEREERERTTGKIGTPPKLDPFHTLRCLIIHLGEELDDGSKEVMVEDGESSHAMFIKVNGFLSLPVYPDFCRSWVS